jgi:hypothetical protein
MSWNPSSEVAVARNAAKALGADQVVIIYTLLGKGQLGMASFGKTKRLCDSAGRLGDSLYEAAMEYLQDQRDEARPPRPVMDNSPANPLDK